MLPVARIRSASSFAGCCHSRVETPENRDCRSHREAPIPINTWHAPALTRTPRRRRFLSGRRVIIHPRINRCVRRRRAPRRRISLGCEPWNAACEEVSGTFVFSFLLPTRMISGRARDEKTWALICDALPSLRRRPITGRTRVTWQHVRARGRPPHRQGRPRRHGEHLGAPRSVDPVTVRPTASFHGWGVRGFHVLRSGAREGSASDDASRRRRRLARVRASVVRPR